MTTTARRSPFSLIKSLFFSSSQADSALDHPKSFFNRLFRKSPPRTTPHLATDLQVSVLDDDGNPHDRRLRSPHHLSVSRRTNSERTAHSISRLSSSFAHSSPDLSSLLSVVPTSGSIAEQRDILRTDCRTDLVRELTLIRFLTLI